MQKLGIKKKGAGRQVDCDFDAALPPEQYYRCPSCGHKFAVSETLYVARDKRLPPDPLLHAGEPYRFLPLHFTAQWQAVDPGGIATDEQACPACHFSFSLGPRQKTDPASGAAGKVMSAQRLAGVNTGAAGGEAPAIPTSLTNTDGVKELIAAIQGLLSRQSMGRTSGDQLAQQYAELCRQASVRLQLCEQLMSAGMREEALRQANTPPPLSELGKLLEFPEINDWRQLCARNRWAMPPKIDIATAREIENAKGTPPAVEAAHRALRRAAAEKSYGQYVKAVHALHELEPQNNSWHTAAAEFEPHRQRELIADGFAAAEAGDLTTLNMIMAQLTGYWANPPSAGDLEGLQSAWKNLQAAVMQVYGQEAAAKFAAACEKEDLTAALASAAKYEEAVKSGFFTPDETTRAQRDKGQVWFIKAKADYDKALKQKEEIAALEVELAKPEPGMEVNKLLASLLNSDAPIDPDLRQRAEANILGRARKERWQRRKELIIKLAILLVAVGALGVTIRSLGLRYFGNVWREALDIAIKKGDVALFDREWERLHNETFGVLHRGLERRGAIKDLKNKRDALVANQQSAAQAYEQAVVALQVIEAAGFDDPDGRVQELLKAGRTPPLLAARATWLNAYESRWQTNQTERLTGLLDKMPEVGKFSRAYVLEPLSQATQTVATLNVLLAEAQRYAGADKKTRDRLAPYIEAAELLDEGTTNRLAIVNSIEKANTLEAYYDGMARYATRFEFDWLAKSFDKLLVGRETAAVALAPLQDFLHRRDQINASNIWMDVRLKEISVLNDSKTLVDLRWAKRKGVDDIILVLGLEKGEPNRKGQWGPIYIPDAANIQPEFKHGMVVDSVSWGQGLAESATKPLPQTRIVRDMLDKVSQFSKAEDGESYLEEHFRRIAAMPVWSGRGGNIEENELLSLSFKIQYLSFLAEQMVRISPLPEWKEISAVLKGADDPPVSWICFRHTRARDIDRRGVEALASLFGAGGAMQRLNIRRAAQQLAAKTPIIWGGYVDFNDSKKIMWLRGAINREAAFFIDAVTSARGTTTIQTLTMTEARKAMLLPGQPLLKWADGATTLTRLKELAAMVPEVPMEVLPTAVPEWFPAP